MSGSWCTSLLLAVIGSLHLMACAPRAGSSAQAGMGIATPSQFARDRLVIREHTDIVAVAATQRSVFAVSTRGLIVYDRIFQRWRAPDARLDEDLRAAGVMDTRIRAIAADPVEDAVWLAVPGAVVVYRVAAQQVQRFAVAGQPDVIRFARGNSADAYVRTGNQWLRISRAGFVTPVTGGVGNVAFVPAPQLPDVYQRYPALRGQLPLLLRDANDRAPQGVFPRIAAATFSFEQPSELFVGTIGDGLWSFNADFLNASALRYGLLDESVGALAVGADGVWAAGQGQGLRGGLSFVGRDAQQFVWRSTDMGSSLRGLFVRDLVVRGSEAWLATDRGVRVLRLRDNANVREITTLHGLPSNDVTSLLVLSGATWIGTRAGLTVVTDTALQSLDRQPDAGASASASATATAETVDIAALRGVPVYALARSGSVVIVGTARGVFAVQRGTPAAASAVSPLFTDSRVLQGPIRAVATSDSVLLVVTDEEAFVLPLPARIIGTAGRVPPAAGARVSPPADDAALSGNLAISTGVDVRAVGRVAAAALDERSVWVAGERAVLSWGRDGTAPRVLRSGREIPELVSDVLLDGPVVWIGTRHGLVRVQRARDGGLP